MMRKQLGLSAITFAELSDRDLDLVARASSSVIGRAASSSYDCRLATASAGETDEERFRYVGLEWLEFIVRYGRLAPQGRVLDIGCGAGRMAVPLSLYLNDEGIYCGFDVSLEVVESCRAAVRGPNRRFDHYDLHHRLYNPAGAIQSHDFEFPYPERFFDVAFAASVFTHIDARTSANYLKQIARVLRPGGTAIVSLFVIPEDQMQAEGGVTSLLGGGSTEYSYRFRNCGDIYTHADEFGNPKNHYMQDDIGDPVAYEYRRFCGLGAEAGLTVREFLPGAWQFKKYQYGWQDMFVFGK